MNLTDKIFCSNGPVDRVVSRIEEYIVVFAGFSGLIVMFVNIVCRYLFHFSLVWAEEYARYCLIVLIYFGTSLAVKRHRMLKVEILVNVFPKLNYAEELVEVISGVIVMALLFYAGYQYTTFNHMFQEMSSAIRWLPMWIIYAVLPVSAVFIMYRYIQRAVDLFQEKSGLRKKEDEA